MLEIKKHVLFIYISLNNMFIFVLADKLANKNKVFCLIPILQLEDLS